MKTTNTNNITRPPALTRQNSTFKKLTVDPKFKNKVIDNGKQNENKKEPKKTNRDTVLGKLCSCCGSKNKGNTPHPDGEAEPDGEAVPDRIIPEHNSMNPSQSKDPHGTKSDSGDTIVNITINHNKRPIINVTPLEEEDDSLTSFLDPVRNVRISLSDIPKLLSRMKL
jgi:hypothetical protein